MPDALFVYTKGVTTKNKFVPMKTTMTKNRLLLTSCLLVIPASSPAKDIVSAIIGGTIGHTVGKAVGKAAAPSMNRPVTVSEETLPNLATQMNKKLPIGIDSETRLDAVRSGPGKRFTYSYTTLNYASTEVDVPKFQAVVGEKIWKQDCSTMTMFRRSGVIVTYEYRGKDGRPFARIEVNPALCSG